MSGSARKREQLRRENRRWGAALERVPREQWPHGGPPGLITVFRSRSYLVQIYDETPRAAFRMTACRTAIKAGRWQDGISWDDLQRLKREAGLGGVQAIEIYPPDSDVVDDANMRHLWILTVPLDIRLT